MINSVTIQNDKGESINLGLRNPEQSGFFVLGVDGLAPGKATVNLTEVLTMDGGFFNSAHGVARNILFNLGFRDVPSVEYNRQKTYQYFPKKRPIKMTFNTDSRVAEAIGYVESNEIDIFSKAEGSVISVLCPDPHFYATVDQVTYFSGVSAGFEFPFENTSLTVPTLEMGTVLNNLERNIYYEGDAEVGIVIHIKILGSVEGQIRIFNEVTREQTYISLITLPGSGVVAGDEIIISTVPGDKYARLIRGVNTYNILSSVGLSFFKLTRGDNLFIYDADSGIDNIQLWIENRIAYDGI